MFESLWVQLQSFKLNLKFYYFVKFVIFALIPLILSIGIAPAISFGEMIDSPRKQMQNGIIAKDVTCKSVLTLMIRTSGDAVCVKPTSAEKLLTAGFGTIQPESSMNESMLTAEEAQSIAEEAFIFGYPLVMMDLTAKQMTNVPEAGANRSPINQFAHFSEFPTPDFTDVVKPNADTLYSTAFLDLSEEPIVLHVPDTDDRYYLMPMFDAYTNVFESPGKRTTGTEANDFAIVGPFWEGTLPEGVIEIQSPTELMWIIGRTQANGVADFDAVNLIQEQYTLTPLSSFGKSYQPPQTVDIDSTFNMDIPPVTKAEQSDASTFFDRMAILMKANPSAPDDTDSISKFSKIGLIPGVGFDSSSLNPEMIEAIESGANEGLAKITSGIADIGINNNGWQKILDAGSYGTNYLLRASIGMCCIGSNLPEDAIYVLAYVDSNGEPLHGDNKYLIHFPAEQTPPVNAFWSITAYGSNELFIENPIDRYSIGDRDELEYNEDGSLDIYMQYEAPEGKESNWLPSAENEFNAGLRMYWPQEFASDGTWEMTPIQKIE